MTQDARSDEFTNQDTWRIFRIMSEFVDGYETMSHVGPAVSIFGSARTPKNHADYARARKLAGKLGKKGFSIITGGGPGIMEAANRGAFEAGAKSVGLNITLPHEQASNQWTNVRLEFRYFFARLVMFVKYACSFVCFPGGFGTLHEFFNSMTLIQTSKAEVFPVILIGRKYWSGLAKWMKKTLLDGSLKMISPEDMYLYRITDDLDEAVRIIVDTMKVRRSGDAIRPVDRLRYMVEGTVEGKPLQPSQPFRQHKTRQAWD
ncbi:MAG: TIGR00730 family Rossman fold protein [Planctomycetes bacterium]|nr:TIGR00730 family Rossman fold protein [Planctomycetota bacterium]